MPLHATIIEMEDRDDLTDVVAEMARITAAGRGWINVLPEIPVDKQPPRPSMLSQVIRRNTPDVALGTWTPSLPGPQLTPQQLGVQHHLGMRLLPELATFGLERPAGWRRVQDSPRRGLVLALPYDESYETAMGWLLRLVAAVTRVESSGRFLASVHQGRPA